MYVPSQVIYPVFVECCQYVSDSYWETIFMNLATNNPTSCQLSIQKNNIVSTKTDNSFEYCFEGVDAKTIYTDLKSLVQIESTDTKTCGYDDWSSIRKKGIKDLLVEMFVIDKQREYELSVEQSRHLLSFVLLSIAIKTIDSDMITLSDDKIQDIKGISFEKGSITISDDFDTDIDVDMSYRNVAQKENNMNTEWEKHLTNLRKKMKSM